MKLKLLATGIMLSSVFCFPSDHTQAQCSSCESAAASVVASSSAATFDLDGRVEPQAEFVRPRKALRLGLTDPYTPAPLYSYTNPGLDAGRVHTWNQQQANVNSWHGGYNSWRYGQPTALVVPPTAAYQSTYSWGVGQTRSTPIHHQFGRGPGSSGGVAGGFRNRPLRPWSTDQFGIYPVRASW